MTVQYNRDEKIYYIKEKIDNQTFEMGFEWIDETEDTVYYNVFMSLYNKRKHKYYNEDAHLSTGLNPFKTIYIAQKAFNLLEKWVVASHHRRVIVLVHWTNSKRREVYHKFLSKRGYEYMMFENCKYIGKIFNE